MNSQHPSSLPPPKLTASFEKLSGEVRSKLAGIKLLLMDVDGVLTNAGVHYRDDGDEGKAFSTRDGFMLAVIARYGLLRGVISGRTSPATANRCRELKLDEIHLGKLGKLEVFNKILSERNLRADQVAFIGDDVIDLPVLLACGVSAAPLDSHVGVLPHVSIILNQPGGHGAVREFLDLWLIATHQYEQLMKDIFDGKF